MKMFKIVFMLFVAMFLSACMEDMALPEETVAMPIDPPSSPPDPVMGYYFPDVDGDTFGDASAEFVTTYSEGMVENNADCNDADPLINPDATDSMNLIDDDCSGKADDNYFYVFVTNLEVPGNTSQDGVGLSGPDLASGPDGFCQSQKGNLPGKYKAWMSGVGNNSPAGRFTKIPLDMVDAKYVLVDGTVVADSWADLTDGTIDYPINLKIDGTTYVGDVWTAVTAAGEWDDSLEHALYQDGFCTSWSVSTSSKYGHIGRTDMTDSRWTLGNGSVRCNTLLPVICMRQY